MPDLSDPRSVIIRPVVTEKSTGMQESGKYVFEVQPEADKVTIRKAVEQIFNVRVAKVCTIKVPGKRKRVGRYEGRTPAVKKAVVTLAKGDRIELFEGV